MDKYSTSLNKFNEKLNDEQKKAFAIISTMIQLTSTYPNVFITGPAGVGKSFLIETYYKYCVNKYGEDKVFKTSTTGISAININGVTIHSWSGIGIGSRSVADIIGNMFPDRKLRWKKTKVLFIDEISMLHPDLFDMIYIIANKLNKEIQFIITGDFFQLPVVKSEKQCFEAKYWNTLIHKTIILKTIVRQKDQIFQNILNEIRIGICSDETERLLRSRLINQQSDQFSEAKQSIKPTKLYPKNINVDLINERELNLLISNKAEHHSYKAEYKIKYNYVKKLPDLPIPDNLKLAVGAQVMFKKNLSFDIANGSRGLVIGFRDGFPLVKLLNGEETLVEFNEFSCEAKSEYSFVKKQLPLKLAWACTIHSSQGLTLDYAEADIGNDIFEYGQTYVVLSRVKNLEGLFLTSFDKSKIMANPKVLAKYDILT